MAFTDYWDEGNVNGGVDTGSNNTDIARFWDGGVMYEYIFPTAASGGLIKTIDGVPIASIKTIDGVAIALIKTYNGVAIQ
jgi:hypothetical protein